MTMILVNTTSLNILPTPGSPYLGVQSMLGYVGWKADVTDLTGKAIGYITINADPLTRN